MSSDFLDAYRHMLVREVVCPKCGHENVSGASAVIEIQPDDTAYCTNCSKSGPVAAFLLKSDAHGRV